MSVSDAPSWSTARAAGLVDLTVLRDVVVHLASRRSIGRDTLE
ncbi:hypothetical protein [Streptomyces sp. AF1A]